LSVNYRPPALSAAAKMNRMHKAAVAMRRATRANSQKTVENIEALLRLERGEDESEE